MLKFNIRIVNVFHYVSSHNRSFDHKCSSFWHQNGFLGMNKDIVIHNLVNLELTTHSCPWVVAINIWYTKLETLLFTSYVTSLDICKDPSWKPNIAHKHFSNTTIVLMSFTKMVNFSQHTLLENMWLDHYANHSFCSGTIITWVSSTSLMV